MNNRLKDMDKATLTRDVVRALRQVYDPEIPVNIYDLGLIYDITIDDDHKVFIKMTMTAPNCPMSDILLEDVPYCWRTCIRLWPIRRELRTWP